MEMSLSETGNMGRWRWDIGGWVDKLYLEHVVSDVTNEDTQQPIELENLTAERCQAGSTQPGWWEDNRINIKVSAYLNAKLILQLIIPAGARGGKDSSTRVEREA